MKTLIGIFIGITCICSVGFTYSLPLYNGLRDDTAMRVDVRLVEVGGHEYVVSSMSAGGINGGCAISTLHHVGCKACNKIEK